MRKLSIYLLFLFFVIASSSKSQYLCDNEYKFINRQKKKVKKKCKRIAKDWIISKRDSLHIPKKIKLSKIKFLAEEKEINKNLRYNKWHEIDSLFCIDKTPSTEYINKAKQRLYELQLVVYDIRGEFDFIPINNEKLSSVLNFEFDIKGNLIRAVIRRKKVSPYSEIPIH
jgi:hypothetical protein